MARTTLMLGVTAGTGSATALAAPVHAGAGRAVNGVPAQRPQAAPVAPVPAGGSQVVAATTDASAAAAITATGARPKAVRYPSVQAGPDRCPAPASRAVTSWYVDTERDTVAIGTPAPGRPRRRGDIAGSGSLTLRYGCSATFSVTAGFGTAGHCGRAGRRATGSNRARRATSGGSSFPGDGRARAGAGGHGTPMPRVSRWNGTHETVRGATRAPAGTGARTLGYTRP